MPDCCGSESEAQHQAPGSHSEYVASLCMRTPALPSSRQLPAGRHGEVCLLFHAAVHSLQVLNISFSSYFKAPCFMPPPPCWGLPKWASTGCSVEYQRLLLNLLASTPSRSLHTPYEGTVQVLEPTCASCITPPAPKSISRVKRPGSDLFGEISQAALVPIAFD